MPNGLVTLVANGTTNLTITRPGTHTVTVPITVTAPVGITSISSTPSSLSGTVGGVSSALVIKDQAGNVVTGGCTFATSDASKATVSSSGVVTYVAVGTATITVTHTASGKTCTVGVTVADPVTSTYYPDTGSGDYIHTDQRAGGVTDLQAINLTTVASSYPAWGDGIHDVSGYSPKRVTNNFDGSGTKAIIGSTNGFASGKVTSAVGSGVTSVPITLGDAPLGLLGYPQRIVLGWLLGSAEEVYVTAWDGTNATLQSPTANAHAVNDPVAIGFDGGTGVMNTSLSTYGRGAGRTPHHVVLSVMHYRGRTAYEVTNGIGVGAQDAFATFNPHITGGGADVSNHGVSIAAPGGFAGRKDHLFLREKGQDRLDFLTEGNFIGNADGYGDVRVTGSSQTLGMDGVFGATSNTLFDPDTHCMGKAVREVYELATETTMNAGDGIVRRLVDYFDGAGLRLVHENTSASVGPEMITQLQMSPTYNSPMIAETEYWYDVVIYEVADGRVYANMATIVNAPQIIARPSSTQVTYRVNGLPASGVDSIRFFTTTGANGLNEGPYTQYQDFSVVAGDLTAGYKDCTLTISAGTTYNFAAAPGFGGHYTLPTNGVVESGPSSRSTLYLLSDAPTVAPSGKKSAVLPTATNYGSLSWGSLGPNFNSNGGNSYVQTAGGAGTQTAVFRSFVSSPLAAGTVPSGTYTVKYGAATESNNPYYFAPSVYVYRPSTDSVVGSFLHDSATGIGNAANSSTTGRVATFTVGSSVTVQNGDRLVVESYFVGTGSDYVHFQYDGNRDVTEGGDTGSDAKSLISFPSAVAFL